MKKTDPRLTLFPFLSEFTFFGYLGFVNAYDFVHLSLMARDPLQVQDMRAQMAQNAPLLSNRNLVV